MKTVFLGWLLGVCLIFITIQALEINGLKHALADDDKIIADLKTDKLIVQTEAYRAFVHCEKQTESPRHSGIEYDQFNK